MKLSSFDRHRRTAATVRGPISYVDIGDAPRGRALRDTERVGVELAAMTTPTHASTPPRCRRLLKAV